MLRDFAPQLLNNLRLLRDFIEEPGKRHSSGVSSCKKHGHKLIPQDLSVARETSQSMEEGIAFV